MALSYASLALPLPTSVQSNGWLPHAAVALLDLGADTNAVSLDVLTSHMTLLAGQDVSRVSATRGAWVMDKQGLLGASKKGTYLLNDRGVAFARTMRYGATPVVVPAPVSAPVEVVPAPVEVVPAPAPVKPVGVSWLPPVVEAPVDAYYGDEYLLALAVEQTACFGTYSPRAEACGSCPIAGACSNMLVTRMATVAASLAKRDEEARKVVAPPPPPVVPDAPPPVVPVAPDAPHVKGGVRMEITAAFSGVCAKCRGRINKGETCWYVSQHGMYHPVCFDPK